VDSNLVIVTVTLLVIVFGVNGPKPPWHYIKIISKYSVIYGHTDKSKTYFETVRGHIQKYTFYNQNKTFFCFCKIKKTNFLCETFFSGARL